jgi:ABC-type transport system involved in multi-copper enzyme maturation permease subunit
MRWSVFKDTLRHSIQMTLIWGIGLGAMMTVTVQTVPGMQGLELVELFQSMPPAMLAAFGVGTDISAMATPEGLIAFGLFGKMALIFAAYPVVIGLRISTHEEAEGILDMQLSQPMPRSQFLLERFLAYTVNIAILILLVVGGLYLGIMTVKLDEPLNTAKLVAMTLNLIPVMVLVMAATMFVGALISRRQTVVTIMTIFIIASYVIQTVGGMVTAQWMNAVKAFSFFTYYNVQSMMQRGVILSDVLVLVVVSVVLFGASLYVFERRDIAV